MYASGPKVRIRCLLGALRHEASCPRAGLGWAGLGWAGLGWAGLGWAGLGWAGLGWAPEELRDLSRHPAIPGLLLRNLV